jgi:hypothetical protein
MNGHFYIMTIVQVKFKFILSIAFVEFNYAIACRISQYSVC